MCSFSSSCTYRPCQLLKQLFKACINLTLRKYFLGKRGKKEDGVRKRRLNSPAGFRRLKSTGEAGLKFSILSPEDISGDMSMKEDVYFSFQWGREIYFLLLNSPKCSGGGGITSSGRLAWIWSSISL